MDEEDVMELVESNQQLERELQVKSALLEQRTLEWSRVTERVHAMEEALAFFHGGSGGGGGGDAEPSSRDPYAVALPALLQPTLGWLEALEDGCAPLWWWRCVSVPVPVPCRSCVCISVFGCLCL